MASNFLLLFSISLIIDPVQCVQLTQSEKLATLAIHNAVCPVVLRSHEQYRCNVSPKTASMPAMTWDVNLEAVAQRYC